MKQDRITRVYSEDSAAVERKWVLVDASGLVLGRIATQIAMILRGKMKAQFTPNMDVGDFVVVINASKVRLTGKRDEKKVYIHHSGYPGGQKIRAYKDVKAKTPEFIIEHAVKGMLPKNSLGARLLKKLKMAITLLFPVISKYRSQDCNFGQFI